MSIDFAEIKKISCLEVAKRLGMDVKNSKVRCFLPGHTDRHPSCYIYPERWKCPVCDIGGDQVDMVERFNGVSKVEAAEWLQREFGLNNQMKSKRDDHGVFEREHIYPGGQLKKAIFRKSDGSKYGVWYHLVGSKWVKGRGKVIPPLYPTAPTLPDHFFLVEGEKDVNTWRRLGKAAVSLPDAASSTWYPEYADTFKSKSVYIIQDNDTPGKKYAQRMAETLHDIAASVKVLDLSIVWPDIPDKGDTTDLIERFGDTDGANMILELAMNSEEWKPEPPKSVFDEFGFYSIPDLTEEEKRPPEFIVDGMIPCGMTFLSGAPKIRKSFFALQMAAAVATGQPFLGLNTTRCDVAYLDLEGSKSRVSFRAERMTTAIPRNVHITNTITERLANGLVDKLRELHRQMPTIRLIIIDTYSRARGSYKAGGANAYDADVSLLEPIQRMALEENIAVVFVHHDKKGAGYVSDSFERLSGTMGISGSSDAVLNLVADGKRFDGKATLEYTPRDARGGEKRLIFDERFNEWQEVVEVPVDVRGNPVCDWIINNVPERGCAAEFRNYQEVFRGAYNCQNEKCGDIVRDAIIKHRDKLFSEYLIGVQVGVKNNGQRGIRLLNLM